MNNPENTKRHTNNACVKVKNGKITRVDVIPSYVDVNAILAKALKRNIKDLIKAVDASKRDDDYDYDHNHES